MSLIIQRDSFADKTILLVEDSDDDVLIMKNALQKAGVTNPLQVVNDGELAVAYLSRAAPYADRTKFPLPVVIFLDLSIPKKNGFEFLAWLRSQPKVNKLTVHVLSASTRPADIDQAAELGANSFLVKPSKIENLVDMLQHWHSFARFALYPDLN